MLFDIGQQSWKPAQGSDGQALDHYVHVGEYAANM